MNYWTVELEDPEVPGCCRPVLHTDSFEDARHIFRSESHNAHGLEVIFLQNGKEIECCRARKMVRA